MAPALARYDGHADWYDENFAPQGEDAGILGQLLRDGDGQVCLDVACGTGRYAATVASAGYHVVGIDISADQLRIANGRSDALARGDAAILPVRSASIDAAVSLYLHTDVEDFHAVVADVARCLKRGGRFVYIGLHPCFIGAFVDRTTETDDQRLCFVAGYGSSGWVRPGFGGGAGLWNKVAGHHKTLSGLLGAFLDAELQLERVLELSGGGIVLPRNIAVAAFKS